MREDGSLTRAQWESRALAMDLVKLMLLAGLCAFFAWDQFEAPTRYYVSGGALLLGLILSVAGVIRARAEHRRRAGH